MGRAGFEGGELFLITSPSGETWALIQSRARFGDFLLEVDARLLTDSPDGYLRIFFRGQGGSTPSDRYEFHVFPQDQTFRVILSRQREGGADWAPLLRRRHSDAINSGSARNRLGVRAQGSDLVLLVNGQEVGRVLDGSYREGLIGIGVGRPAGAAAADGRFSTLQVSRLN